MPGTGVRRTRGPDSVGSAASRPRVTGCWGWCSSFVSCSGFHDASSIHHGDAVAEISDNAEIMRNKPRPMPVSRLISQRRSRICAWIVASNAVVGSSAISTSGSPAKAIAIITRWFVPPESSCGYCFSRRARRQCQHNREAASPRPARQHREGRDANTALRRSAVRYGERG